MYAEKTGNKFSAKVFKKKIGKYYPVDVAFENENIRKISDDKHLVSKLHVSVQKIMKLLFDVDQMKRVMLEFDLDMEKMPLGKISSKQISNAMTVLNEMTELVKKGASRAEFIGASNKFYTLIPHDFGERLPPIIFTLETINQKIEMLESLLELEVAYGILNRITDLSISPMDEYYDQLKANIDVVSRDSDEFDLLSAYLRHTHADTHRNYDLEIINIFKVNRDLEGKRYEPFKNLHNRKLLWHGSRTTNFAGILSHGLKIAPPEAPVSGYMFGKGIYFADMVSKAANYCFTSQQNKDGLVLLCEVALGNVHACTTAKNFVKPPKNKHSVKGIGKTYPNPVESVFTDDGVEIPMGKSIMDLSVDSSLLYNEFIVYDAAQVNIKYLFHLNFNHKY